MMLEIVWNSYVLRLKQKNISISNQMTFKSGEKLVTVEVDWGIFIESQHFF